jgi:hypothetical protein
MALGSHSLPAPPECFSLDRGHAHGTAISRGTAIVFAKGDCDHRSCGCDATLLDCRGKAGRANSTHNPSGVLDAHGGLTGCLCGWSDRGAFVQYGYSHPDYRAWVECVRRKTLGDTTKDVVAFIQQEHFNESVSAALAKTMGKRCKH